MLRLDDASPSHSGTRNFSTPSSLVTPPRPSPYVARDASPIMSPINDVTRSPLADVNRSSINDGMSSTNLASPLTSPTSHRLPYHEDEVRSLLEGILKIQLPDQQETSQVLSDGVLLCNLVNHLRPRSVPTIYVPSPQVSI